MKKLFLTLALGLLFSGAYAQQDDEADDQSRIANRYGITLVKEGNGWAVKGLDKMVARYKFNPDTVPAWTEPWTYVPERLTPDQFSRCTITEGVEYKKYDGYNCRMDVYLPKEQGGGPFPFVIFMHGGRWTNGHEKTPNMTQPAKFFASNGVAVMSVSYTLSGQGTFVNTAADLNDALAFIQKHASEWGIAPDRFGWYGFSAGGHLSEYMGMTAPGTKMFITSAGPADLTFHQKEWETKANALARYFGYSATEPKKLQQVSPLFLIPQPGSKIPPALIIQGTMDGLVAPQQAVDFAAALKKKGAPVVDLMMVTFGGHGAVNTRMFNYEENMFRMLDFAKKYL